MRDHVVNWVFTAVDDGEDWEWQDSLEEAEQHMRDEEFPLRLQVMDNLQGVRNTRTVVNDVLAQLAMQSNTL